MITAQIAPVDKRVVRVSTNKNDPAWDEFLENVPGGQHTQTSRWAQLKAFLGFCCVRVIVREGQRIVGGGQILIRRMRILGKVAYISKGPVMGSDDGRLTHEVLRSLRDAARAHGARVLFLQPPSIVANTAQQLAALGFRESPIETGPTATTLVDLSQSLDRVLANMRKGTRKNIRRSERDGISVREGTEADLPTFHRLLVANSQRRGFATFPEEYFREMWRILVPHDNFKLFLSEMHGETVSAQAVVSFGDTTVAKQVGWSGEHGRSGPNEALDWATIKWSKSRGYRYYDLEGISPSAVTAIRQGEQLPADLRQTPTFYKLGFGGEARLLPQTYCYIFNPLLRMAHGKLLHAIAKSLASENALSVFRTRATGIPGDGQTNK